MGKPIVVIGSSNIDFAMKMDRLPRRDESVTNAEFIQAFGGKGANQAVAAARAGGDVYFVNCVGDDLYAEAMVAGYAESGVRTEFVFRETGVSSGTALIMIGEEGHNYLSVAPGANYRLTPERIDGIRDLIDSASCILMQFEIPAETVRRVLETAHALNVPVIWNYAPAQKSDLGLLKFVQILVANEPEASVLAGTEVIDRRTALQAAVVIREHGVETVIVTLGEAGSVIVSPEGKQHVPAFPVKAVDTTAAGDTYCGCLAVALAEGRDLAEAVRFAGAAAALSVQKMGAQPSTPWREDIEEFLKHC